jgi:hypothetical protein
VFCIYLRTNSDLCHLQHKLIGFYNRDEKCLQRGTGWVFKYNTLRFICKGLNLIILMGNKNLAYSLKSQTNIYICRSFNVIVNIVIIIIISSSSSGSIIVGMKVNVEKIK